MAMEGRQELEAQLRQLHAGLTEGQEAARNEGRKEAERLEARVKELLKDRSGCRSVLRVVILQKVRWYQSGILANPERREVSCMVAYKRQLLGILTSCASSWTVFVLCAPEDVLYISCNANKTRRISLAFLDSGTVSKQS